MNDAQRRQWLIDYYKNRRANHQDSSAWIAKINRMSDQQVFAIYMRLQKKN